MLTEVPSPLSMDEPIGTAAKKPVFANTSSKKTAPDELINAIE
jgi:hypothetical protein